MSHPPERQHLLKRLDMHHQQMMYHADQRVCVDTVEDMVSTYDNALLMNKKSIYVNEISTFDAKTAAKVRKCVSDKPRIYKALYENKIAGSDLATYRAAGNPKITELVQASTTADDGEPRRDFILTSDNTYAHSGAYKKYYASNFACMSFTAFNAAA
jgi:hypothetical protein